MTDQSDLEEKIDKIELYDKTEEEMKRIVSGISQEGFNLRRRRKHIRYQLYRMKGSVLGQCSDVSAPGFKEAFEAKERFDGWRNFGVTWDVALDDPERIVHRTRSVAEEWDDVIKAKFPVIEPGGRVVYPDVTVRHKVEAEAALQAAAKSQPDPVDLHVTVSPASEDAAPVTDAVKAPTKSTPAAKSAKKKNTKRK